MADKTLSVVAEKMEQEELLGIMGWASIKAFLTMASLFLIGYFVLPVLIGGSGSVYATSFVITFVIFAYVFKMKKDITSVATWGVVSLGYSIMLYFFGELIFIALVAAGIAIVALFLGGDAFLSGVYTYNDLKKWVREKTAAEASAAISTTSSESH
jgi:hypothetical protein